MLNFSLNYSEILKRNNDQTRSAQNDFQDKLKQFTGNDLIETFVEQKKTGIERPGTEINSYLSNRIEFDFSILVSVQFEELDQIKTSLNLMSSSTTPDLTTGPPEELISFDSPEANLPNFQPHFPVSSPTTNMKKSDSTRGKYSFPIFLIIISASGSIQHPFKVLHGLYITRRRELEKKQSKTLTRNLSMLYD